MPVIIHYLRESGIPAVSVDAPGITVMPADIRIGREQIIKRSIGTPLRLYKRRDNNIIICRYLKTDAGWSVVNRICYKLPFAACGADSDSYLIKTRAYCTGNRTGNK
jgi:hypothetical protein